MRTLLLIFASKMPKYADTGERGVKNGHILRTSFMDGPLLINNNDLQIKIVRTHADKGGGGSNMGKILRTSLMAYDVIVRPTLAYGATI